MNTANNSLNPQNNDDTQTILKVAQVIKKAKKVCILTGAGISAESGIPTFRDKQTGLWENFRAEDLANVDAFDRDPKMVWSWYQWRRNMVNDKAPNPAHYAIAAWQQWAKDNGQKVDLITQNVDDLHEQAGSLTTHLHGHLWRNKCSRCGTPYKLKIDYCNDALIECNACGGYIRPDIVWFGEALPQQEWHIAEYSASNCDVFISIGTSSLVYPAAGLAQFAKQNGAKIIEVNLNPTQSPSIDVVIEGKAGETMPALVKHITS